MSVGPMTGIAAGAAGTPLSQTKGTDAERAAQEAGASQHAARANSRPSPPPASGKPTAKNIRATIATPTGVCPGGSGAWRKTPRPTKTPRVPLRRRRTPAGPPAICWT